MAISTFFHNGGITRLTMDDILVSQREQKLHIRTIKTLIKEETKRKEYNLVVAKCSLSPNI
jgi:hypothetical protein